MANCPHHLVIARVAEVIAKTYVRCTFRMVVTSIIRISHKSDVYSDSVTTDTILIVPYYILASVLFGALLSGSSVSCLQSPADYSDFDLDAFCLSHEETIRVMRRRRRLAVCSALSRSHLKLSQWLLQRTCECSND